MMKTIIDYIEREIPTIFTDAPGDSMELIQENIQRALKVQEDHFSWRKKQKINDNWGDLTK